MPNAKNAVYCYAMDVRVTDINPLTQQQGINVIKNILQTLMYRFQHRIEQEQKAINKTNKHTA